MELTIKLELSDAQPLSYTDIRHAVVDAMWEAQYLYGDDAEPMLGAGGWVVAKGHRVGRWSVER
jgi:hypothetical protein